MRILHMADIHLGAHPDKGRPFGEGRDRMLWDALADTLAQAGEMQVDLVLIAGDLFHRQPLRRELREVNELFGRLGGIPVVLMAGNHDYISKNSAYRGFEWHNNVHMFQKEQIECIELPELGTCIYGFSYEHRELRGMIGEAELGAGSRADQGQRHGLLIEKKKIPGAYHILMAHGGDEKHFPMRLSALKALGMDYVALGHIHKPAQWEEDRIVMAGSLQALEYQDAGKRGCWIVDLVRESAQAFFFPVPGCEYVHDEIEVNRCTTNVALMEEIEDHLHQAEGNQIFKIILTGVCDPDMKLDTARIEALPRVAAVEVKVRPAYDYDRLREEYKDQILGRYIQRLQEQPQTMQVRRALSYGVDALLGK